MKKIFALFMAAVCISLSSCSPVIEKQDMRRLYRHMSQSEQSVMNYLGADESDIEDRSEYVVKEEHVDLILKDPFKYRGAESRVLLMFIKDHLEVVEYRFSGVDKDVCRTMFKYAKILKAAIDKDFKTYDEHVYDGNTKPLEDVTESEYMKDTDSFLCEHYWIIDDKYGLLNDIHIEEYFYDEIRSRAEKSQILLRVVLYKGKSQDGDGYEIILRTDISP